MILVISVITSGGLWLLAAHVLPQAVEWAGAALSTLTTGLALYMYSSGVNKKRQKAIDLHAKVGRFLGQIRGNPDMREEDFWENFKLLEHEVFILDLARDW
jgi:hypothetical protein